MSHFIIIGSRDTFLDRFAYTKVVKMLLSSCRVSEKVSEIALKPANCAMGSVLTTFKVLPLVLM